MKITVYSTPTCPHCMMLKEFLKENKIAFTDKNVADDETALKEMMEKTDGYMSVPVVEIDGKILLNPEEEDIKKELKMK